MNFPKGKNHKFYSTRTRVAPRTSVLAPPILSLWLIECDEGVLAFLQEFSPSRSSVYVFGTKRWKCVSFLTTSLTIDFTIFSSPLEHKNALWRVAMLISSFLNIPNRKIFRVLTLKILENHLKKSQKTKKKTIFAQINELCSNRKLIIPPLALRSLPNFLPRLAIFRFLLEFLWILAPENRPNHELPILHAAHLEICFILILLRFFFFLSFSNFLGLKFSL